jgi:hypothetical protein
MSDFGLVHTAEIDSKWIDLSSHLGSVHTWPKNTIAANVAGKYKWPMVVSSKLFRQDVGRFVEML